MNAVSCTQVQCGTCGAIVSAKQGEACPACDCFPRFYAPESNAPTLAESARESDAVVEIISAGAGRVEVEILGKLLTFRATRAIDEIAAGLLYRMATVTVLDGEIVRIVAVPVEPAPQVEMFERPAGEMAVIA